MESYSEEAAVDTLEFDNSDFANTLFGAHNENLEALGKAAGVSIRSRGTRLFIQSPNRSLRLKLAGLLSDLYGLVSKGHPVSVHDVLRGYALLESEPEQDLAELMRESTVLINGTRKAVAARNQAQKNYLEALKNFEMVFAVGPAGTGKTYLAVAMGLSMLTRGRVKRIILTRPAVEAGERLGFLPGDLAEKVNPYLRPLHDALNDMMPQAKIASMGEAGIIEIAPLAFMRGRTLNDAYIILDEAQNTTREQMKMFLTRMGFNSRVVITGDITQIDLPEYPGGSARDRSGLVHAIKILKGIKGVFFINFSESDVVRHPLVRAVVNAYEHNENNAS